MSDGGLHSFWSSLQRAEQRMEAEAKATERDLYRTVYGYKSRVMRLRSALAKSGPIAFQTVSRKLEGIDLKAIWPILFSAVRDMALYYGGSVVLGTAVGAGLGSLAFGFGAIPGAAIGAEAGSVVGDWVLIYLGLQMLAEGLVNTIPPALRLYVQGFRLAWGPVDSDRPDARYSADYHQGEDMAAHRFADGHVLMIIAILMAMVAYLTRGKSEEALMQAVRKSERLGTKMADWLADNRERLLKEESLRPRVQPRAQQAEEDVPRAVKRASGRMKSAASTVPDKAAPENLKVSGTTAGAPYRNIVDRVPGKILSESDALTPGPLGDDVNGLPGTFSGGRYATMQLDQPLTVYRAWTPGQSRELGAFWSLDQPTGSLQTRIDSALLPEWGNIRGTPFSAQATQYTTMELPAGTVIHIGEVGSQGGTWVGGGSQLIIEGGPQADWAIGGGALQ